jgi:hypothetical protein
MKGQLKFKEKAMEQMSLVVLAFVAGLLVGIINNSIGLAIMLWIFWFVLIFKN